MIWQVKKEHYCCVHAPILNIKLSHVVIDELHLLLRIMDVLIGNLVKEALQWDKHHNWGGGGELVRSCRVSFDIWKKINAG
jgi:hypothetical protein